MQRHDIGERWIPARQAHSAGSENGCQCDSARASVSQSTNPRLHHPARLRREVAGLIARPTAPRLVASRAALLTAALLVLLAALLAILCRVEIEKRRVRLVRHRSRFGEDGGLNGRIEGLIEGVAVRRK